MRRINLFPMVLAAVIGFGCARCADKNKSDDGPGSDPGGARAGRDPKGVARVPHRGGLLGQLPPLAYRPWELFENWVRALDAMPST